MKLVEIKDQFNALYMLECQKRNVGKIPLGVKEIAFFISSAQQDIQRRLAVVTTSYDITLTGAETYALPSNFGNDILALVSGVKLEKKTVSWLREIMAGSLSGDYYAIYPSGNTQYILTSVTSGTLTIYYHPDLNYYRPSLSGTQNWGTFDGITYSGNLLIPDRYDMAVLYRMLGFVFPDYLPIYEKELKSLRESRVGSTENTTMYEFGGFSELEATSTASSVTGTTTVPTTGADKFARIRITDVGGATVSEATGWDSNPTVANNITSIVISSANSEFGNYSHVGCNNKNFEWSATGADTITLTPPSSSGWGEAEIIIEIWN